MRLHCGIRAAAARQDRKLARYEKSVDKKLKALGQQALMPLLLQSKPELESIELDGDEPTTHTVTSSTYKSEDLSSMLPLLLMSGGSGGLFGGDASSNPMMLFVMMKALEKEK